MKRRLTKRKYKWLQKELIFLQQQGQLSAEKTAQILALYEIKGSYSLLRVCLTIGALLIGIGVLSFIAGNWHQLPAFVKFGLILIGLIGTYLAGWRWERTYPKTARSLYYVGMFIYGAGIFLIGQMFHLSIGVPFVFLLWAVGILPLSFYLRDRWVTMFIFFLLFFYLLLDQEHGFWVAFLFLPYLCWLQLRYHSDSYMLFVVQHLFTIYALVRGMVDLGWEDWVPMFIFLCGVLFSLIRWNPYQEALQWLGALHYGLGGIALTFKSTWPSLFMDHSQIVVATSFTILYILWLAYLLQCNHLPVIVVICALILRFYVDFSFDFLPKSLFFILGGMILIASGYWFERQRRKRRQTHEKMAK